MALVVVRNSCDGTEPTSTNDSRLDKGVVVLDLNMQSPGEDVVGNESITEAIPAQEPLHVFEIQDDSNSVVPDGSAPQNASPNSSSDLQFHLLAMFNLLDPSHVLKMAVKLESSHVGRTRYLAIVSCKGKGDGEEETCLLGVDGTSNSSHLTLGLVVRVYADTSITLDGDGGFSLASGGRQHIFKPVSVHTMWAVLQTLHKASSKAQDYTHFAGGQTHQWAMFYEQHLSSDQSCINEWHAMGDIESRRPPSPDCIQKPKERAETELSIRFALKEVMMTVDLDEVTSKFIRAKVEELVGMECSAYKSFIDEEMLTILGQMDKASKIFDHVYLGSEWNASNLEELQRNSVGHILNVTREIDNFFPHLYEYMNIRVYDDEATELLKYWDKTFKYISKAQAQGSNVLVHCKMGVSRSASVVIAYAMKAYDWNLQEALHYVCSRRSCVNPNESFKKQLETYAGILDASKHRHNKLFRSKSETNLKPVPPSSTPVAVNTPSPSGLLEPPGVFVQPTTPPEPPPLPPPLDSPDNGRPKSWSPDESIASALFPSTSLPADSHKHNATLTTSPVSVSVLVPCNGRTYSVSQNRAVQLDTASSNACTAKDFEQDSFTSIVALNPLDFGECETGMDASAPVVECVNPLLVTPSPDEITRLKRVPSVKDRICELESAVANGNSVSKTHAPPDRTGLVLNNISQFEPATLTSKSKLNSPHTEEVLPDLLEMDGLTLARAQRKPPVVRHQAILVRPEHYSVPDDLEEVCRSMFPTPTDAKKQKDDFSAHVDRVFDREERTESRKSLQLALERESPSRQSSWGSSDSAMVRDFRDTPSRQHSWSSGDTRNASVLPSRNSSWGSYDIRPLPHVSQEEEEEDLQFESSSVTGTIKRKPLSGSNEEYIQRITNEEVREPIWHAMVRKAETRSPDYNSGTLYSSSPSLNYVEGKENTLQWSVFPASLYLPVAPSEPPFQPPSDGTPLPGIVRKQRQVLENFKLPVTPNVPRKGSESVENGKEQEQGVVRRLKEELEAKSGTPLTGAFAPMDIPGLTLPSAISSRTVKSPSATSVPRKVIHRNLTSEPGMQRRSLSVDKMNCRTTSSPSPPLPTFKSPCRSFSQSSTSAESSESPDSPASDTDAANVRLLMDIFEVDARKMRKERPRVYSDPAPILPLRSSSANLITAAATNTAVANTPLVPVRHSSLDSETLKKPPPLYKGSAKPPVPVAMFPPPPSLHKKAKKHQGRTHPLERLSRSGHPLSSTM